jgi:hypothetical protein
MTSVEIKSGLMYIYESEDGGPLYISCCYIKEIIYEGNHGGTILLLNREGRKEYLYIRVPYDKVIQAWDLALS